ncbi:hypothetical protein [Undibacterium flavidum]|uniref:Uncharacterized protein n=1 Tax=Undibacterium flavidum TaxID=2762297 RepID=A0ABR6YFC7_9BURK|nr:hypothetical protein [Undibacterium flavidum]MBC3875286.1 hypothetical protein [Undibacterium flavidum]
MKDNSQFVLGILVQATSWRQRAKLGFFAGLVLASQVLTCQVSAQVNIDGNKLTTASAGNQKSSAPKRSDSSAFTVVAYNRNIKQADFAGLSKVTVLRMQKQLQSLYQDLPDWQHDYALVHEPLNDGIVGPITLHWLQRFSYNFKILAEGDYANNFPANIDRISQFAQRHPDEIRILLSREFDQWDEAQAAKIKNADFQIRRQGKDNELIALVNRFREGRRAPLRPKSNALMKDSGNFTYSLSRDDIDVLVGKDQLIARLSKLKDKEFTSDEALQVAVAQATGHHVHVMNLLWPLILRQEREFDGFLISESALVNLRKEQRLPADALEELKKYVGTYFKTRTAFDTFIEDKANADVLFLSASEVSQLAAATKVFDNVHLSAQAIDNIKKELKSNIQNEGIPEIIGRLLSEIQDVDYAEVELFRSAAISKIAFGVGACKLNSPSNNEYVKKLRMREEEFILLQKDLSALTLQMPADGSLKQINLEDIFAQLSKYRNALTSCDDTQRKIVQDLVRDIYIHYFSVLVESAARKKMPELIANIQLSGADCGCALDNLPGVVYGFYPYWKNKTTTQAMNFRVMNRIAYYGLSVNSVGDFQLGEQQFDIYDGSSHANQFIRTARQHNSKVDWLIEKNDWDKDWKSYSRENKKAVFKKIATNIRLLLREPLDHLLAQAKPLVSFGISKRPTRGDGVSLYFPNYPSDADSASLFNEFYLNLRKELENEEVWINIVVPQSLLSAKDERKNSAFSLKNLVKLRKKRALSEADDRAHPSVIDEYILVLMEEPSSDAKKQLRLDVEDETSLHGAERAQFLRNILPVLHFDNRNWQQLEDDIVYARDNFGGIAFWAPSFDNLGISPVNTIDSCLMSAQMANCLLRNYSNEEIGDSIAGPIEKFACVYRWFLLLISFCLILVGVAIGILYYRFCKVRELVFKYWLWILTLLIAPLLFVSGLLLVFSPDMASVRAGNKPLFVVVIVFFVAAVLGYRYLRALGKLPSRQRAMPARHAIGFPIVVWSIEEQADGLQWIIRNRGTGDAIIKKVSIDCEGNVLADMQMALELMIGSDDNLHWKSATLIGRKIRPGESLAALTIADPATAQKFRDEWNKHHLKIEIVYASFNNEYWKSNGVEIVVATSEAV